MSDMVERVAEAIAAEFDWNISELPNTEFAALIDASLAAIRAMREPTPEMVKAGQDRLSVDAYFSAADNMPEYWRAMVNAALPASSTSAAPETAGSPTASSS